jgi:uncharacterized membrane protein YphA (DoxX/SURF4 family)
MNAKPGIKEILGLLARLIVGGVFIYAGLIKALAPAEEFGYAIESYKLLDARLALWAAYIVPWVELYTGLLLAGGVFTRFSALFTGAMLAGFEFLLGQAWLRHLSVTSCGCFGSADSNSLPHEFVQNLFLLALAAAAFKYGRHYSADRAVEKL